MSADDDLKTVIEEFTAALETGRYPRLSVEWAIAHFKLGDGYERYNAENRAENRERAITHYAEAAECLTRVGTPTLWATAHTKLGDLYRSRISGEHEQNLDKAIKHYQRALEVLVPGNHPLEWAAAKESLAQALRFQTGVQRTDNLEQAISHINDALQIYTRDAFPVKWAACHNSLGSLYSSRIRGEPEDNFEKAIESYTDALAVRTKAAYPEQWAATQWNLALAYQSRVRGQRGENLEKALEHYHAAEKIHTRELFPADWAAIQAALGIAYKERANGARPQNLEKAIECFEAALDIITRSTAAEKWAQIQNDLGGVYLDRPLGERASNLEKAIECFNRSLEVRTRDASPEYWATEQNNLGIAYSERDRGDGANSLERAIELYGLALEVRTREAFPREWARSQKNLADAYSDRYRGGRAENIEQSIEIYYEALKVLTRSRYPSDWAMAQFNLATAYFQRIRGEGADNVEKAIELYNEVLEVYTRDSDDPADWAMTQVELANAYGDRIQGDKTANLERAIELYRAALGVYVRNSYPAEWARTNLNLATTYLHRKRGDKADNLERAIEMNLAALQIYDRKSYPRDWATAQQHLAIAYTDRVHGDKTSNLSIAISCFEAALEVYSRDDDSPGDWAMVRYNLASVYEKAGNRAKAVENCVEALRIYTREAFPADYRQTQSRLGRLYFGREDWIQSHAAYSAAIDTTADQLHQFFTEGARRTEVGETSGIYVDDANCLLRLNKPADAFLRLEAGRTRLLAEILSLANVELAKLPIDEQEALRTAVQSVRVLEAQMRSSGRPGSHRAGRQLAESLHSAREEISRIIRDVRHLMPDFGQTKLDLSQILGLIPKGGALISMAATIRGGAIFVLPYGATEVTEDHVIEWGPASYEHVWSLVRGGSDVQNIGWTRAYENYRSSGESSSSAKRQWLRMIETVGRALWDFPLGQIHSRLKALGLDESAPIVLLPQGWLRLLPLHAAWRPVNGIKRYFLDDWTVAYAPSCYVLFSSRERLMATVRQGRTLLAVSDPTDDLPHAALEVSTVRRFFEPAYVLQKAAATKDEVLRLAPESNYIHMSCHGFYDWDDAMQSGLHLTGGQTLTLSDVVEKMDLRRNCLVTLSACESGITDTAQAPDEFVGLQAGFLQAGAPAVVSTLWSVSDRFTELLMKQFYENLFDGSGCQGAAAALRRAQQWLRDATVERLGLDETLYSRNLRATDRPYAHPYFWAAFVINGPHVAETLVPLH